LSSAEARSNISITFYKNGFVLDEGELRPYEDPANRAFLDAIDRGEMPPELGAKVRTGEVGVDVQNRRTEDYVAPPYRAFSGAGSSVGAGSAAPTTAVFAGSGSAVSVDESKPIATIQVKLVDGRRERVVLNLSHTVADLQARVAAFKATTKSFVLLAGFPPKPLATPSATIEAAGLKGAAVTQKEA
jgi:UBX domain-containing protein 1